MGMRALVSQMATEKGQEDHHCCAVFALARFGVCLPAIEVQ